MITLTFFTLLYFAPTLVASHRGHPAGGILVLNLLFGWTGIGWVVLLLWALLVRPIIYFVPHMLYQPHAGWRRY